MIGRTEVRAAVEERRLDDIERWVADEPRVVRLLLGLTYELDEEVRATAATGVGFAARHHPSLAEATIRRLVWAMNDESGTNGVTAPIVLQAIARERPDLLLPVVPDLVRLSTDEGLHDRLADALCIVVHSYPGGVGHALSESINRRIETGECCDDNRRR